uniref:Uncharacterized protein n=1 Tax=Arundo donax TaxID=35708 RepID=A0A0A8ZYF5_ARUDO
MHYSLKLCVHEWTVQAKPLAIAIPWRRCPISVNSPWPSASASARHKPLHEIP